MKAVGHVRLFTKGGVTKRAMGLLVLLVILIPRGSYSQDRPGRPAEDIEKIIAQLNVNYKTLYNTIESLYEISGKNSLILLLASLTHQMMLSTLYEAELGDIAGAMFLCCRELYLRHVYELRLKQIKVSQVFIRNSVYKIETLRVDIRNKNVLKLMDSAKKAGLSTVELLDEASRVLRSEKNSGS